MSIAVDKALGIIWSNNDLNYEDWIDTLEEEFPDIPEDLRIQQMYELNEECLEDERTNLDITLNNSIIVIADIGRWDGRVSAYKMIESGNIADCLFDDCDYQTWYVDEDGEFRCEAIHHDGTNYYWYRECTGSDEEIEDLQEKIYYGTATKEDIEAVTSSLGKYIGDVYGY